MELKDSINLFVKEKLDYFKKWTFEEPILMTFDQHMQLEKLQQILYKCITFFVENYSSFEYLMPVSEDVKRVLKLYENSAYSVGTYRTDFVFDVHKRIKIIEISCRCSLNAFFMSSIFNTLSKKYINDLGLNGKHVNSYEKIYEYIESYIQRYNEVYVLRGRDKRNESKIFVSVLERFGKKVKVLELGEIEKNLPEMKGTWIITELSFDEILSLPFHIITKLVEFEVFNDLRTVFLIHDKRFFSVLKNEAFLNKVLKNEEKELLKEFCVSTYKSNELIWEEVKKSRSNWVIKPTNLGNGTGVVAGCLTSELEWTKLIQSRFENNLIAQKWIEQKVFEGKINDKKYAHYITGTLLFFGDNFFGLGPYRTCSSMVINQINHRKAYSVILKE